VAGRRSGGGNAHDQDGGQGGGGPAATVPTPWLIVLCLDFDPVHFAPIDLEVHETAFNSNPFFMCGQLFSLLLANYIYKPPFLTLSMN
jgi:hypothetical protein